MSITIFLLSLVMGVHKPLPSPDDLALSPKGKSALAYLEEATLFETVGIGNAGKLSRGASALQTLYAERDADSFSPTTPTSATPSSRTGRAKIPCRWSTGA